MVNKSKAVVFDKNPGRNAQTYGIARQLNTDEDLIRYARNALFTDWS